ncbi:MAG: hypothetical protein COV10_03065 [Candidatus Vogelbacteria bacterium CG10_big_fil_rev_8_21_14_0_10_51_16]|uniref:Baseplate protein J-like domain-containing protein n=1 Tax=Candidatus Vogelbacteria bacterium CG10_big_fil_rev_8_21_14_0_10_51_16 TaxID=1975045 RepID=A0A2H0RE72_9BACT|nr:MAG: hypothetical protein COV10_03065 [Candidatus Vogelbacteria bacterium CG10_big_fil_rev_8_21_14_0_10_51_16]
MKHVGQDIIIPKRKEELIASLHNRSHKNQSDHTDSGTPPLKHAPLRVKRRIWIWVTAIFFLLVTVGYGMSFFSYATVGIVVHDANITLKDTFTLSKEQTAGTIPLKTMTIRVEENTDVPATEKKQVSRKASGEIIIYNKHDEKPQQLIARTRFETPEGKIYRLDRDVNVPGATVTEGKLVPGALTVRVFADLPGEEYNLGLRDLTIPGFKGTPRQSTIFARSKTEFSGGFIGEELVAGEVEILSAETKLEEKLKNALLTQAEAQLPEGYLTYEQGIFVSVDQDARHTPGANSVKVSRGGTLTAILINKAELLKNIAEKKIPDYKGEQLESADLASLRFSLLSQVEDIASAKSLLFRLEGPLNIAYNLDQSYLQASLAGIPKADYVQVLNSFPAIVRADIDFSPSWLSTFPTRPERIKIRRLPTVGTSSE